MEGVPELGDEEEILGMLNFGAFVGFAGEMNLALHNALLDGSGNTLSGFNFIAIVCCCQLLIIPADII